MKIMKIILILMLTAIAPASAGIYKWTDSEGRVHFGDQPANSETATELNIIIKKNTGVTNSSGHKKDREYLLKKIDKDKEEKAKKRSKRLAEANKRKRKCDAYRASYQSQIQSNRSYYMSPDGERTYLSDKERSARKKKLSKGVSKYCR
jgi:hypothetical protein